jgi:phosphoribosylglycinamide formyltransferase 1
MELLKIAVLISGRGSNLQAIIDSIDSGYLPARVICVISDKPGAEGLKRAEKHNIEAVALDYKKFPGKDAYEAELLRVLKEKSPDLICLAGYMRIVGKGLISAFKNRIVNIHPALLPSFPGLDSQKQALDHGVKISGCTVHFVDEGCDTGPIILQKAVPVSEEDTEASLSARILEQEHKAYPEALRLLAEGRVRVEGRKAKISKEGK